MGEIAGVDLSDPLETLREERVRRGVLGLRGELFLAFVIVTLFAIGVNTLVLWRVGSALQERERLESAAAIARALAGTLKADADRSALVQVVADVPGLRGVALYDPQRRLVKAAGTVPSTPPREVGTVLLLGGEVLAVTSPEGDTVAVASWGGAAALGAVAVWTREQHDGGIVRRARRLTLAYVALDALLAGLLGWYLVSRLVIEPVRRLAAATRRVSAGERGVRVAVASANELGSLAHDFNRMTRALAAQEDALGRQLLELRAANVRLEKAREQVARSEKLASVGRLAAGVAHELGNPVAAVTGYVSALLRGRDGSEAGDVEMLRRVEKETKRIDRIIRDLLDFARPHAEAPQAIALEEIVDGALAIAALHKAYRNVELRRVRGSPPAVLADPHRLQQVLVNLLVNALDALDGVAAPVLTVETGATTFPEAPGERRRKDDEPPPEGPASFVRIRDNGPGIPPENLDAIFDPFFTTKPPGRGTGLGLAIARQSVEAAGGSILVESGSGAGSAFTVLLPPLPPASPASRGP